MTHKFHVGDHVGWNSEAGHVKGKVIGIKTKDFQYKGYTHHATSDNPQYLIKSDTTDHVAAHYGDTLHNLK